MFLFVFITNYMRLNYYKKDSFNWLNVVTMISINNGFDFWVIVLLFLVLILGLVSTTDYILGNQVLWSVAVPEIILSTSDGC